MDFNPEKLDKLFQQAAEGFRPDAPENSWLEIEKRIQSKRKKGIGFWLSIASLFLIFGGTGAWMFLSYIPSNKPFPSLAVQQATTKNGDISFNSSKNSSEQIAKISTHPTKNSPSNKVTGTPSSTAEFASDKEVTVSTQSMERPTKSSSVTSKKKAELSNSYSRSKVGNLSSIATKTSKRNLNVRPSKNDVSGLYTIPKVSEEDDIEKNQDQVSYENPQRNQVFFAYLESKTPKLAIQWKSRPIDWKVEDEPISQEKPKKNLFDQMPGPQWCFVFQPEYVNNSEFLRNEYDQIQNGTVVSVPVNPNFRSSLNSLNHNVGFSFTIQSRFTLQTKTGFDVGLSYGYRNDRQNYFECFNPNSGESKLYFQPISGWNNTPQTFLNSYHYASMPMGLTHALTGNLKSTGFRLHWNIVPQFLVTGTSMTFDFSKDGFVTGSIAKNNLYRRAGFSGGLGLGYALKVSPRTLLETGIQWNGNWSTMFNGYYPVDKRFGAIGARIGLVFK